MLFIIANMTLDSKGGSPLYSATLLGNLGGGGLHQPADSYHFLCYFDKQLTQNKRTA